MIYFLGFFILVVVYALITNRLNRKTKCSHDWKDEENGAARCAKCDKVIQNTYNNKTIKALTN